MADSVKENIPVVEESGEAKAGHASALTEQQLRLAESAYDAMKELSGQRSGSCLAHEGEPHARAEVLRILNKAKGAGVANTVMETLSLTGTVGNVKKDADGNVVRGNLKCADGSGLIFRDKAGQGWTIGHQGETFYGDKAAEVGMKFVNSVLNNPQKEKFAGEDSETTVEGPKLSLQEKELVMSGLKSMLYGDQAGMQAFGQKLANQEDGGAKILAAMDWGSVNFGVGIDKESGKIKIGNIYSGYMVVGKDAEVSFEKGGSADGASTLAEGIKSIQLETRMNVAGKLIATEGMLMQWSREKGTMGPTRQQPIALGREQGRFGNALIEASKEYLKSDEHKQFKEEMSRRKAEEDALRGQK